MGLVQGRRQIFARWMLPHDADRAIGMRRRNWPYGEKLRRRFRIYRLISKGRRLLPIVYVYVLRVFGYTTTYK